MDHLDTIAEAGSFVLCTRNYLSPLLPKLAKYLSRRIYQVGQDSAWSGVSGKCEDLRSYANTTLRGKGRGWPELCSGIQYLTLCYLVKFGGGTGLGQSGGLSLAKLLPLHLLWPSESLVQ